MTQSTRVDWSRAAAILSVLTAVALGTAHLAYEDFYRTLGVTLDEIGLSNARMLGRSVLATLAFVGVGAIAAVIAYPVYVFDWQRTGERSSAAASGFLLGALGTWLFIAIADAASAFLVIPGIGVVGLAFTVTAPTARGPLTRGGVRVMNAVVLVTLAVVLLVGVDSAADAGRTFSEWHGRPDADRPFAATILDIAPMKVCVHEVDSPPRSWLLLGSANGMTVFYDIDARRATRLPTHRLTRVDTVGADGTC